MTHYKSQQNLQIVRPTTSVVRRMKLSHSRDRSKSRKTTKQPEIFRYMPSVSVVTLQHLDRGLNHQSVDDNKPGHPQMLD